MVRSWDVTFDVRVQVESKEILTLLAQCHALASVIDRIPITPSRQQRLNRLNILRAVRGTTGIEGADLTETEVGRIIDNPRSIGLLPGKQREEQEARNADKLMRYVARLLRESQQCNLSEALISKFHEITTQGIKYERNTPGEYRSFPVVVGDYRPPSDGGEVRRLMEQFVRWFHEDGPSHWDPIVGAIVAHFYVVSIHPFGDGNGRTSRAVESFLLYRAGINARGFYSLANYYYQHRMEYTEYLDHVRFDTKGDLTPFVFFALKGLAEGLVEVHSEVLLEVREIAFRDFVRERLSDKLATESGKRMLDFMFMIGYDPVPVKDIRQGGHPLAKLYRGLTPKTLLRDLTYLKQQQLVRLQDKGRTVQANIDVMGRFLPPVDLS